MYSLGKDNKKDFSIIPEGTITNVPEVFASSSHCGLRKWRDDLSLIFIPGETVCSGVFTTNKFAAAPVILSKKQLAKNRNINAVCINSGIANACTGAEGISNAESTIELTSRYLNIPPHNIVVSSTGRIGKQLPIDKVEKGIEMCSSSLSPEGGHHAAKAILTIDRHPKEVAVSLMIKDTEIFIGGIAKGSVMLEPNMATTLSFIATNIKMPFQMQDELLLECIEATFNSISTDGCQSTNDMSILISNGNSGIEIKKKDGDYRKFRNALFEVMEILSRKVVEDAEGATKVIEILVTGAGDKKEAKIIGKKIANSILFKSAMYGQDVNWGRIAAAIGSIENSIDSSKVDISLEDIKVMDHGVAVDYDEEAVNRHMHEKNIKFIICLNAGTAGSRVLTNDITYEYIKINAFYKKQR